MKQPAPHRYRLLATLALLACVPGLAATVYRTVDENGLVSFSDTKPEGDALVETLQIDAQDPQLSAEDNNRLEAMRETTDRMASDRREREKHRAQLRRQQASTRHTGYEQPDYTEYMGASSGYNSGYSGYYGYPRRPLRPGHRPGYRPHPEHPIAHPPLRPPEQVPRSRNAQLMRPIVSPRR